MAVILASVTDKKRGIDKVLATIQKIESKMAYILANGNEIAIINIGGEFKPKFASACV